MYMLILFGGPYGAEERVYRVPMSKDKARSVAADFRRRIGCRCRVVPLAEES